MPLGWDDQKALIEEAQEHLRGGTFRESRWHEPELTLIVAQSGVHFRLLLSLHPRYSRCHLSRQRKTTPSKKSKRQLRPPFFERLDSLAGARLEDITLEPKDRILHIRFVDVPGESSPIKLTAELFGAQGNLFLLGEQDRLLWTLRARSRSQSWPNEATYRLPPPPSKKAGRQLSLELAPHERGPERWSKAADRQFSGWEEEDRKQELYRRRISAWKKQRGRKQKALAHIEKDIAAADKADESQRNGDRLLAFLHQVKKGQPHVDLPFLDDLYADKDSARIHLDPRLTPHENAQAQYQRARKLRRRAKGALQRIDVARKALDDVNEQLARLENQDLALITLEELEKTDAPDAPKLGSRGKVPKDSEDGIRRLVSRDGLGIWIGRSSEANDRLSFRIARGKDLWLHVHESPGSHVIVRLEGRSGVPSRTLEDACQLAVYYSKLRDAAQADVIYTPAKWVKRPGKGSPKGLALPQRFKTYHVRPDSDLLETLLDSK